jgi:hypothetical protein
MKVTVTALAIKAMFLVRWSVVLFTHVRGFVLWFWLLGLTPILMVRRWEPVAINYGPAQLVPTCPPFSTWHPIRGFLISKM